MRIAKNRLAGTFERLRHSCTRIHQLIELIKETHCRVLLDVDSSTVCRRPMGVLSIGGLHVLQCCATKSNLRRYDMGYQPHSCNLLAKRHALASRQDEQPGSASQNGVLEVLCCHEV